jgi:hypothetical protein
MRRFLPRTRLLALCCWAVAIPAGCDRPGKEATPSDARPSQPQPESQPAAKAEPFKLDVTVSAGDETARATIYLVGQHAVEFAEGKSEPEAVYDLREMSWRDLSSRRTVRLTDCEVWAKATVERTKTSLAKTADPKLRRFVEAQLDPQFKVREGDGKLTLANDVFKFEIRSKQSVTEKQRDLFFRYDTLNAYRKAMLERKLAPFPQLAVGKELAARDMVPNEMTLTVTTSDEPVRLRVELRVSPVSAKEKERVSAVIRRATVP